MVFFEAYVQEEALVPRSLRQGQVVVMDNLSWHKGRKVRELIEGRGCELLHLPPYSSPELNPIELAFAKLKASLAAQQGAVQDLGGAARGDGAGAGGDLDPRCLGFLPPLRLPPPGPTAMTDALTVVC